MKGGGQPFAALTVGSRAVVNRKTLAAMVSAVRGEALLYSRWGACLWQRALLPAGSSGLAREQ
jgi:hypothetical protein